MLSPATSQFLMLAKRDLINAVCNVVQAQCQMVSDNPLNAVLEELRVQICGQLSNLYKLLEKAEDAERDRVTLLQTAENAEREEW